MSQHSAHPWSFFRAGGFDQVNLRSGADIANMDQLDPKLWVALACPTSGLEFDSATLALLDSDKDGRIRAPEIIAACKWSTSCLQNPDDLFKGSDSLSLSAINGSTPEGATLLASAKQILANLGKPEATTISIAEVSDTTKIFSKTPFNGDGIITALSTQDEAAKKIIQHSITTFGSEMDRSGEAGINQAKVDHFFKELKAYSDWWSLNEQNSAQIMPLGDNSPQAFAAFKAIQAKIDDYFSRCRLAAFDGRALSALNRQESEYLAIAAKDFSITAAEVCGFPLAKVEAGKSLPLTEGLNPAWANAMACFRQAVVTPLLGEKEVLTETEWTILSDKFKAYADWSLLKAGTVVEPLGLATIREILAGPCEKLLTDLIAQDKALESESSSIATVEKLLRFHRDLVKLLVNFVSFQDFYSKKAKAVFQVGTLFLDTRSCELCIAVQEPTRHATMATLAGSYLAYCDCVRKATNEKMQIVAVVTNGDNDNLMVGRNGIFYDRKGKDWDATITKIVDHPISIRQAFWTPYKKLVVMIENLAAKRAIAANAESDAKLEATALTAVNADKVQAENKKVDVGAVAAISVAIAGIGALVTTLFGQLMGLLQLPFWQFCLVVAALISVVSGPAMILAWLKLRKRNLGPILDANGWAINAKAKINVPFGASLTQVARLPIGAKLGGADNYGEKPNRWLKIVKIAVVVCFISSLLNHFCIWDSVVFKLTHKHFPQIFKQAGAGVSQVSK